MSIIASHLEALAHAQVPLRERLDWYVGQFGLTFDQPISKGQALRKQLFGKILNGAIARLSDEDRKFLDSVPVVMSDLHVYGGRGREYVNAAARFMEDGSCASITIYWHTMLITDYGKSLESTEEYIDWTRRLLMHEIGHARDRRSDEEMARTDRY